MALDNVILIGMSGAGKSTLGVLLAKALGKQFVDTDIALQQADGRLLQQILDSDGVEAFLRLEEDVIAGLELHDCVIATGGSVVYSDRAMQHLKQNGIAVYLAVEFAELETRLSNITTRGIVFKGKNDLYEVYRERLPLYQRYADITVDCSHTDVESALSQILQSIKLQGRA